MKKRVYLVPPKRNRIYASRAEGNRARTRRYRALHPERVAAREDTPEARFSLYKRKALFRGKPFSMSFDEFMGFWQQPCVYCGSPIRTVGIDRVDNEIGYSIGNCVPCCKVCNTMKLTFSTGEWLKHIRLVLDHTL